MNNYFNNDYEGKLSHRYEDLNNSPFITFRRHYLDNFLESITFEGCVLDVGGKKFNKRGRFHPPMDKVITWEYINTDLSTKPDFCCNAEKMPITNDKYDWVLLCEVLEHLSDPYKVIDECIRILKPGGKLVVTAPFLNGIHADPCDFQRWIPDKYHQEFVKKRGLMQEKLIEMGGIWAVIWDLFYAVSSIETEQNHSLFIRKFLRLILPIIKKLEQDHYGHHKISTGYGLVYIKNIS